MTASTPAPPRKKVDWEAVERDYRTTRLTFVELAEKHGTSTSAIGNQVKRKGWQRDLADAVRQATSAKLIEKAVSQKLTATTTSASQAQTQTQTQAALQKSKANATAQALEHNTQAVLAVADLNASIIIGHRQRLQELHHFVADAQTTLEQTSSAINTIKDAATLVQATGHLVNATKTLIEQERKAYGLDEPEAKQGDSVEDLLLQLDEAAHD